MSDDSTWKRKKTIRQFGEGLGLFCLCLILGDAIGFVHMASEYDPLIFIGMGLGGSIWLYTARNPSDPNEH